MKKAIHSKIFWTLFVVFSLGVFIFLVNTNRAYESKSDILIVAKNEAIARDLSQIIENAKYIPSTVAFYDKMIEDNGKIVDVSKNKSLAERKSFWEDKIESKRIGKSGVIQVAVVDSNKQQAEILSNQVGITLASYLSTTYDIKTDIDLRIIDGPITTYSTKYGFLLLLLASILIGLVFSFFASLAFQGLGGIKYPQVRNPFPVSLDEMLKRKKTEMLVYEEEKNVVTEKPQIVVDSKKEKLAEQPVEKPNKAEAVTHFSQSVKAAAPENLPVADTSFLSGPNPLPKVEKPLRGEESIIIKEPTADEVKKRMVGLVPSKTKRPTPEEVKERLNNLLAGKY